MQEIATDLALDPEHQLLPFGRSFYGLWRKLRGAGNKGYLRGNYILGGGVKDDANLAAKLQFPDGCLRQEVTLTQGISQEKAKEIVKIIKDLHVKVQAAIQGDEIRVSSKNKDDLQSVIQNLRTAPLTVPIQFVNFR